MTMNADISEGVFSSDDILMSSIGTERTDTMDPISMHFESQPWLSLYKLIFNTLVQGK